MAFRLSAQRLPSLFLEKGARGMRGWVSLPRFQRARIDITLLFRVQIDGMSCCGYDVLDLAAMINLIRRSDPRVVCVDVTLRPFLREVQNVRVLHVTRFRPSRTYLPMNALALAQGIPGDA
jgi:hypothetical protein